MLPKAIKDLPFQQDKGASPSKEDALAKVVTLSSLSNSIKSFKLESNETCANSTMTLIIPSKLKSHLNDWLLVDTRPPDQFTESHIQHSFNLFVAPILAKRWQKQFPKNISLSNLVFPESERTDFETQMKQRKVVVLLDFDQTSPCDQGSVLSTLAETFKAEGYQTFLLQGGYAAWTTYQEQGAVSPSPVPSPTDTNNSPTQAFKRTTSFLLKTNQLKPVPRPLLTPTLDEPSQILDWLYLGPDLFSSNVEEAIKMMNSLNITAILNMTFEVKALPDGVFPMYKQIACQDSADERIEEFLDPATEFIENARMQQRNVYVHCKAGKSRSATVVLAYLVKYQKMPLDEAHTFLRSKRPVVAPNIGFLSVLKEYEVVNRK